MNTRYVVMGSAVALLLFMGIKISWDKDQPKSATSTFTSKQITQMSAVPVEQKSTSIPKGAEDYLSNRELGQWRFSNVDVGRENMPVLDKVGDETVSAIEKGFVDYENIPEVKELKDKYSGMLYVTFYTAVRGGTSKMVKRDKVQLAKFGDPRYFEICLYPEDHRNAARIQDRTAFYDPEWKAVMMAGVNFTQPWQAGIAMHELYHAKKASGFQPGYAQNQTAEAYVDEEVNAHEMNRKILDQFTNNKYSATIEKLLKKLPGERDPGQIPGYFSGADYQMLDALFSLANSQEAGLRVAQYQFDIGSRWLRQRFKGDELRSQLIQYYRDIAS